MYGAEIIYAHYIVTSKEVAMLLEYHLSFASEDRRCAVE